jgi:hypothetical protein
MRSTNLAIVFLLMTTQVGAETIQVQAPINAVVQSECGEPVALSGFINGTITQTASAKDQMILIESHLGPAGDVNALGMESGIKYQATGQTFTRIAADADFLKSFTYVNRFKIVGLYDVLGLVHVVLNDDGSIKLWVEKLSSSCK